MVTFTKKPGATLWRCDQEPRLVIWKPCDKKTFEVYQRREREGWAFDSDAAVFLKGGFRKRERAEAYVARLESRLSFPPTIKAKDVEPGMLLDLAGDTYADPDGNEFAALYETELIEVSSVERETPDCVVIGIEGGPGLIGFPPEHPINLEGHGEVFYAPGPNDKPLTDDDIEAIVDAMLDKRFAVYTQQEGCGVKRVSVHRTHHEALAAIRTMTNTPNYNPLEEPCGENGDLYNLEPDPGCTIAWIETD